MKKLLAFLAAPIRKTEAFIIMTLVAGFFYAGFSVPHTIVDTGFWNRYFVLGAVVIGYSLVKLVVRLSVVGPAKLFSTE